MKFTLLTSRFERIMNIVLHPINIDKMKELIKDYDESYLSNNSYSFAGLEQKRVFVLGLYRLNYEVYYSSKQSQ